jgi:hypothetical protein
MLRINGQILAIALFFVFEKKKIEFTSFFGQKIRIKIIYSDINFDILDQNTSSWAFWKGNHA